MANKQIEQGEKQEVKQSNKQSKTVKIQNIGKYLEVVSVDEEIFKVKPGGVVEVPNAVANRLIKLKKFQKV